MKTLIRFLMTVIAWAGISISVNAFNYYITFTGSGASNTVDSVLVQNLSKGTRITVPAGMALQLSDVDNSIDELNASSDLAAVYPNPVTHKSVFSFVAANNGNTQIAVYGLDGRKLAGMDINLLQGKNSFQLILPVGVYLVQAKGNGFSYSVRVISFSSTHSQALIRFNGHSNPTKPQRAPASEAKLQYSTGDQILYKGYSGDYCTIVTDKPTESKSTDFKFVDCTDADGNHYAVVHIGTQTWMAENLKTTNYRYSVEIPNITDRITWDGLKTGAWCNYNNDAMNGEKYGKLYNWYAVNNPNIAPNGWHVASHEEWIILQNYLIVNGYNYDGTTTGDKTAKSLASTIDWYYCLGDSVPGFNLTKNNRSGFSALPGGWRNSLHINVDFNDLGEETSWWTSTEYGPYYAWITVLSTCGYNINMHYYEREGGSYIRCVKD